MDGWMNERFLLPISLSTFTNLIKENKITNLVTGSNKIAKLVKVGPTCKYTK